ncbi:DciA family protein [Undibacterium sp.]|uniref:DciA family protein n=1 Tax=Undibacterium sp. TaxID=1914977 RepID=UPI0037518EA9
MQSPHPTYRLNIKRGKKMAQTNEIASFLRHNDKLSPLLPTVKRNISLQKECRTALPAIFDGCEVLNLNEDQLVMSTPNASIAAKLKQQLPKLQAHLQQRGWQINAIKIKVQVKRMIEKPEPVKQALLTGSALLAFEDLENNLDATPQNTDLKAALSRLLSRNRG